MQKNSNLDLIKERLNILDLVSTYIKLEKSGSQFKARCPFHSEKTPSFYVSPGRGTYHCFGCSEHGDIFGFTMKIEGINFKDALRMLADRAGVSLANFNKEETSSLIDILERSTTFFENYLQGNTVAKKYLLDRGISEQSIKDFRIGFAPNDWRVLYTKLHAAGYSDEEIISSGLCIKHEKDGEMRIYDRFRSRIMFPTMNAGGKVVAFSGRIIGPDEGKDGVAKYVNSPETPMYHKSSILFGYDKAKQEIAKKKKIVVVEGQVDVVMAHQAGTKNTVAISGTSFTPEHISIIKRFADTITLALDTDKAGYNAMLKSAGLALASDIEVEGLLLSDKDPAEMIRLDKESWIKAVENPKPILTLLAEIILAKEKIKPKQIQMLRRDLFPLLRSVKSPLLKESYKKEIASMLSIGEEIINQEVASVIPEPTIEAKKVQKKAAKTDLLVMLAECTAGIQLLEEEKLASFYKGIVQKYTDGEEGLKIESIPEDILNRETIKLERNISEIKGFEIAHHVKESIGLFLKKVLEAKTDKVKNQIRDGVDMEENLKKVQEYTRDLNSLNKQLKYD
jgi:DNA primase